MSGDGVVVEEQGDGRRLAAWFLSGERPAAESCPSVAIVLVDGETGAQVYP
jgi:hypothetical protein